MSISKTAVKHSSEYTYTEINESQLNDNYANMEEKFASLCFAEGAIQSFELNWKNFKSTEPLQIQESVNHIIKELIKQINGETMRENQCDNRFQQEKEYLRSKFIYMEVESSLVLKVLGLSDVKDKDKTKLDTFLDDRYGEYQEEIRRLKGNIFGNLNESNRELEKRGMNLQFEVDSLSNRRKDRTISEMGDLQEKFKTIGNMRDFPRLVRNSETIIDQYEVKNDQIKQDFFGAFQDMINAVMGNYESELMSIGMELNEMFWEFMMVNYRTRDQKEKMCDYVDFIIVNLDTNFRDMINNIQKHQLGDKKWNSNKDLEILIDDMVSRYSGLEENIKVLWNNASIEILKLWEDHFPDIPDIENELTVIPPDELETQIIESKDNVGSIMNEFEELIEHGMCHDPVRDYLNIFYEEMIDLEIAYGSVESFIYKGHGALQKDEEYKMELQSQYGKMIEVLRAYKSKIDQLVWRKMKGSMIGWGVVDRKWKWVLREMREEWQERVEMKRRTLTLKGARVEDIQNAIREHDRWLERLEIEDNKLFQSEVQGFWRLREIISKKLRRSYLTEAKDINLEIWNILDSKKWTNKNKIKQMVNKLMHLLSKRKFEINLQRLIGELKDEDVNLEKESGSINQRHLDLWSKALMESDLYWEDLIRGIHDDNKEEVVELTGKLQCYGDEILDATEEPINLNHVYEQFIFLEIREKTISDHVRKYIRPSRESSQYMSKFYFLWKQQIREWKSTQYEKVLHHYLPAHQRFTKLIESYLYERNGFIRMRMDHQKEIKRRWILKNDSPGSIDTLTRVLEEVETSWRRNGISNDERLGTYKNKLLGFVNKVKERMMEMAGHINEQLFEIIMQQVKTIDSSGSSETQIENLLVSVKNIFIRYIMDTQTKWQIKLDEIAVRLKFDWENELVSLKTSLEEEVEEENRVLIKYLDELEQKKVDESEIENECTQNIMKEIESPVEDLYQKMIYNELSITTVRRILWPILGHNKRDRMKAWREVVKFHEKWIEKSRAYKDGIHQQVLNTLIQDHPDLMDIFQKWETTVNTSIDNWKKQTHIVISKYIEEDNGTQIITKIKKRTETFITDALEVDTQLKKHYFESYLERLPNMELEIGHDFMKLASIINMHYFFSIQKIVKMYTRTMNETTIKDPIFSILDTVWKGIVLWFRDDIPTINNDEWQKTLIGSVKIIIENKQQILIEHKDLWNVLNKKFDLAGPDGSMADVIDEGGKCDVFKLIRGATNV